MAITRRGFLQGALGAGAGLAMTGADPRPAAAQANAAQLERNKQVALRFKKAQGTKEEPEVMREVLSPGYKRLRGGMHHLAANADGQGFPGTGSFLRGAIPDRVDVIEEVIAEGDQVGLLFRMTGTHQGEPLRHSAHRKEDRRLRGRDIARGGREDRRRLVHGGRSGRAEADRREECRSARTAG